MDYQAILHSILDMVARYGIWGIFVLMFVENIGLPVPTEIGFLVGQSMVVQGSATYLEIFWVILIGKTIGSAVSYYLGIFFADRIKFINDKHSSVKRAQHQFSRWMDRYGNAAVFFSRLVGYVRPWASYLAGVGEIKPAPFFFYNITGSAAIIVLTMLTLGSVVELWRRYEFLRIYIFIGAILLFIGFWVYLALKRKKK